MNTEKWLDSYINTNFFDCDIKSMFLKDVIKQKIYDYQTVHVTKLIQALTKNKIAIDGSMTGTGKTFTSIAIAKQLDLRPIIVCPKIMIAKWKEVCNYFDVSYISITNYELLRKCISYDNMNKKIKSTFVQFVDDKYVWNLKYKTILIFDEAHKCKSIKSHTGQLMLAAKNKCYMLLLSATIADKTEYFVPIGYLVGMYKNINSGSRWLKLLMEDRQHEFGTSTFQYIFSNYGSCMSLKDMEETTSSHNIIMAEKFYIGKKNTAVVNEQYRIIGPKINKLSEILVNRQIIELAKTEIFFDLIDKYVALNFSVVVFVNFRKTFEVIVSYCKKKYKTSTLFGGQDALSREENINLFQNNTNTVIISMIQIGGESISLHDINGRPRVSLISPSFSCIELIQCLGRIYRSNVLSNCLQIIIFCASTIEDLICNKIRSKLKFMSEITDDDLKNDNKLLL